MTSIAPRFALPAALLIVSVVVLHGTAQSITGCAAYFTFLFAFILTVGRQVRDDPVRSRIATSWVGGELLNEYARRRRRRQLARDRRRPPAP
jgi:hypothetical protein